MSEGSGIVAVFAAISIALVAIAAWLLVERRVPRRIVIAAFAVLVVLELTVLPDGADSVLGVFSWAFGMVGFGALVAEGWARFRPARTADGAVK